jgi:hypothetical protein
MWVSAFHRLRGQSNKSVKFLKCRTGEPIAFATDFIPHYFDMTAIPKDGTAANIKEPNPVI